VGRGSGAEPRPAAVADPAVPCGVGALAVPDAAP
jgi:hypothetical protein